jgi:hypothetical protein
VSWAALKAASEAYADRAVRELVGELGELAGRAGDGHAVAVFELIDPALREALRRAHLEGAKDALAA